MAPRNYIGKLIDGRYQIVGRVGLGGSARVYRARDILMNRTVALKVLDEDETLYRINSRSFETEVEAISKLSHPNIVTIYDVSMRGSVKYIVMEFVDGITLREYLNFQTVLCAEEVFSCAKQILAALENAHENGIIHRDIKPQNVMILKSGQVKVADFGIARLPDTDNFKLDDRAVGTVHYISPEQASGLAVDERSDLYSLGVLMYEMATGSRPFEAADASTVAMMQVSDEPARPRILRPDISPALEQIILRAMRKEPSERYESAEDMLRAVLRAEKHPTNIFSDDFASHTGTAPTGKIGFLRRFFSHHKQEESGVSIDGTFESDIMENQETADDTVDITEEESMKVILDREGYERKSRRQSQAAEKEVDGVSFEALESEEHAGENDEKQDTVLFTRIDKTNTDTAEPTAQEEQAHTEEVSNAISNTEIEDALFLEMQDADTEIEDDGLDVPAFVQERFVKSQDANDSLQEKPTTDAKPCEEEKSLDSSDTVMFHVVGGEEDADGEESFELLVDEVDIDGAKVDQTQENEEESDGADADDMSGVVTEVNVTAIEEVDIDDAKQNEPRADEAEAIIAAANQKMLEAEQKMEEAQLLLCDAAEAKDELTARQASLDEKETEIDEKCQKLIDREKLIAEQEAALLEREETLNRQFAENEKNVATLVSRLAEAENAAEEAAIAAAAAEQALADITAEKEKKETEEKREKQPVAVSPCSQIPLWKKLVLPVSCGVLAVALCLSLWYSGILFGVRVPSIATYNGESEINGLKIEVTYVKDYAAKGTVLSQAPAAGLVRGDTDTVHLVVSEGGRSIYEKHRTEFDENLIGQTLTHATSFLNLVEAQNTNHPNSILTVSRADASVPAGRVCAYDILFADETGETTIILYISTGANE